MLVPTQQKEINTPNRTFPEEFPDFWREHHMDVGDVSYAHDSQLKSMKLRKIIP